MPDLISLVAVKKKEKVVIMANHLQRMGKRMTFTSEDGVVHTESFWCLEDIPIRVGKQIIELQFVGYHNAAAYDAERHPIAGAVKKYLVSGDQFLAAVNTPTAHPEGTPVSVEILTMAWAVAMRIKDQIVPPASPGAEETAVSFFETAVDVQ